MNEWLCLQGPEKAITTVNSLCYLFVNKIRSRYDCRLHIAGEPNAKPCQCGGRDSQAARPRPAPTLSCHCGEHVLTKVIRASSLGTDNNFEGHRVLVNTEEKKVFTIS